MQYRDFSGRKRTEGELTREAGEALNRLVQGSSWFCVQEGFWQWLTERIMKQKFYRLKPYGLQYAFNIWRGSSEKQRRGLKIQYEKERKEWLKTGRLSLS